MVTLSDYRDLVQIVGVFGLFFGIGHLWLTRRASIGKNTIDLINMLQAQHIRDARTYVIQKLEAEKPFPFGDGDAERAAATVVASYDIAAILIREGYVERRVFTDDFGPSVIKCYDRLQQFIAQRQSEAGKRYWNDIGDLFGECKMIHSQQGINSANWTGLA
jgi:hypothetical protein